MTAADRRATEPFGSLTTALNHAERLLLSQPSVAAAQADEILRHFPGQPHARLLRARSLRLLGKLDEAHEELVGLAAAQPRSPRTACELGLVLLASGNAAGAELEFRRALSLDADLTAAWIGLAKALRASGGSTAAKSADAEAVRSAACDPVLLRAAADLHQRRFTDAEQLLEARIAADPEDAPATRLLGEAAWRQGRMAEAIARTTRAVELSPGFVAARTFLVRLLSQANHMRDALEHAAILCADEPHEAGHAMLRASLLARVGKPAEARSIYETLLKRHGDEVRLHLNLGHVCKTLGDQAASIVVYRRAIALAPMSGEAWWSLANLKTVALDAADRDAMRAALAAGPAPDDAYHLHFALGKALEDAGDVPAAFAAYAEGNRLRRTTLSYDGGAFRAEIEELTAVFKAPFLAARAAGGCLARDPIFIVGLPRAGSTLVEQILASHSAVEGTMELPDLMMLADRLRARVDEGGYASFADLIASLSAAERAQLGEAYLASTRIHRKTDRPFFIDKMPNNWQHVGLIQLILPRARIVDVRRHPMACGFSVWKQHFARGQAFSYKLGDIGRYYADYATHMAAIDVAAPVAVHRIFYEDLVSNTEEIIRGLLDALELPFEKGCLSFWRNRRAVRTASSEQVRQPIFTSGLQQWRAFEPFLGELRDSLGSTLTDWRAPRIPV